MNTPEEVGARLRYLRTKRHQTIRAVAKEIPISYPQLFKYEHGDLYPPVLTLGLLCEYYGVSADWLLGTGGNDAETPAL